MKELYDSLKHYSIQDALEFEENDRQFIALKKLWSYKPKISNYLGLIIANSLICYQLSGKGEDYWEELCDAIVKYDHGDGILWILDFYKYFLVNSKNNKRLVNMKLKRLEKLTTFLNNLEGKEEFYYENMICLRDDLSATMKQKKDAKTIVFAVKMFSYGARNCFEKIVEFPKEINIPIDSRLSKIYDEHKGSYNDKYKFFSDLSSKLDIPELHLDAILRKSL